MRKPVKIWVGKTIAAAKAVSTLSGLVDGDGVIDVLDVLRDVEDGVNLLYEEGWIDYNTYNKAMEIIDEVYHEIKHSNPSINADKVHELMESLVKMLRGEEK